MSGAIEVVRNARVRRAKLSFDPRTGAARLTLPPRAALGPALRWAEGHAGWIAAQRARLPEPRRFEDGTELPFGDERLTIRWRETGPRRVERVGDELHVGGPAEGVPRRVEQWLRRAALDLLSAETSHYAARADVAVTRVSIGDPASRWGSCAASGAIRYSWRLILAPGFVRRATVAHEVAHRVHMNHSPAFHRLVATLYEGDPAAARAWLKREGASLHWYGRARG